MHSCCFWQHLASLGYCDQGWNRSSLSSEQKWSIANFVVARLHTRTRQRITAIQTFGSPLARLGRKIPRHSLGGQNVRGKQEQSITHCNWLSTPAQRRPSLCVSSIHTWGFFFPLTWICRGAWEHPDNLVVSYPFTVGLWLEAPREGCFGSRYPFADSKKLPWDLREMKWLERCLEQYSEKAKVGVTKAGNSSVVIGVAKCQFLADACPMARFRIAQII